MPLNIKNIITTFPSEKKWISRCNARARNHAPKAPRAVWAQSRRSTRTAVDIFNALRVFTKEPIREQEIKVECMNLVQSTHGKSRSTFSMICHSRCRNFMWNQFPVGLIPLLNTIHTLRIHYAHATANLTSGYSKYAKVACVHYVCTISLRTSHAELTGAWASRSVIYVSVGLIYFLNG